MSTTADLISLLKNELKAAGVTFADAQPQALLASAEDRARAIALSAQRSRRILTRPTMMSTRPANASSMERTASANWF